MKEKPLLHYGIKRRSGRYPWLSGEKYKKSKKFLQTVDSLREKGLNTNQICEKMGLTTTQFRNKISLANQHKKDSLNHEIGRLRDQGLSNLSISKQLGVSEGTVRNYVTTRDKIDKKRLDSISDTLKTAIKETPYLDIGVGVERQMGISRERLRASVAKLKEEGYYEHDVYVRRLTDPTKYTTTHILTKEKDIEVVKKHIPEIRPIKYESEDGGITFKKPEPLKHVDWKRVSICYAEKGGELKDGVIELRRGAKDLDLGNAHYAQVRIPVGGTHYLKGMAVYSDNLPKGVDIRFNTNKPEGTPKEKVLKPLKDNKDNPFGANIKKTKGSLSIVNEEGDWDKWKGTLSSQFLSKQPASLIKDRLDKTYESVKKEYSELKKLNNPVVQKHLMEAYANEVDGKTRSLKVLGLPRTRAHVILPIPEMKPNEIYAPNYKNGERVILLRHPHGGRFELPDLVVNNNGPGKKIYKNMKDAVGIHPSVAQKLSGADFDGDTVLVIPNNKRQIKSLRSLKELKDFDPKREYGVEHQTITKRHQQTQMGIVSNLITDMTIKDAPLSDIARAVRHSMVVIDAEKHKLDWKQSAIDNGIRALQKKYQTKINPITGKKSYGASTLISIADKDIKDKDGKHETYKDPYTNKKRSKFLMDTIDDARKLSSGTVTENLYADYINNLKKIRHNIGKDIVNISMPKRDPKAAEEYKNEIKSLENKLHLAELNRPRERQAQILATTTYYSIKDRENMNRDDLKKLKNRCLVKARLAVGAQRVPVDVTPKEWEAIQKNAISHTKLSKILEHADMDLIRKYATPREIKKMSTAKITRIKSLYDNNYTYAQIAEALGVSVSTVKNALES